MPNKDVRDVLAEIKSVADFFKEEYKTEESNYSIQIQIHPTTLEFIAIGLSVLDGVDFSEANIQETKELFGYPLVINKYLKGRFAISVLVHEEKLWQKLETKKEI